MILKDAVRQFFFWMVQSGRSPGTSRSYRRVLEELPFQNKPLEEITPQDLLAHLQTFNHLSPGSRNNIKAVFRSFFSWATENDLIPKSPARTIAFERIPMKEAKYLSIQEVQKFRRTIKGKGRDELLFEIALQTGLRLSELSSLNVGMVRNRKSFVVVGKGRKSRTVFLNQSLQSLIRQNVNGGPSDEPLFISRRGTRLSGSQIQNLFKAYLQRAGIKKGYSVHAMRHTFGTMIYRKSRDLRLTQELLGHSNPSTTCRYAHVGEADKRRAIEKIYT